VRVTRMGGVREPWRAQGDAAGKRVRITGSSERANELVLQRSILDQIGVFTHIDAGVCPERRVMVM
jgi:hypothetical protein